MKDSIYRISQLPASKRKVISINPNKKVQEAITLMLLNDFSQLPVMSNERRVDGIISWKSIGVRKQFDEKEELVKNCMVRVTTIEENTNFLDAVQIILEKEYVLIRDQEDLICGIVTLADIGKQFLTHSEPFIEIEQIEKSLRDLIDITFSIEELKEVKNDKDSERIVKNSSNLTFGEYVRIIEDQSNWTKINLNIDRVSFIHKLREVNKIRNKVMHFNIEGLNSEELEELKKMGKFLRTFKKITENSKV